MTRLCPYIRPRRARTCTLASMSPRCRTTLGGPRVQRSLEEPVMSTTHSVGRRPIRLALAVLVTGLLAPAASGAAAAQITPVPPGGTSIALLERPARLRVQDVSLADALAELERRS